MHTECFSGGGTRTIHIHSTHNTVVYVDFDYCIYTACDYNATIVYSYYCFKLGVGNPRAPTLFMQPW